MVKDATFCGLQQRHITYFFLVLSLTALLAINLHPLLNRCSGCPERATPPPHESQYASQPLFQRLPAAEQNLYHKALNTNYSTIWMGPPEVNLVLRYIHGRRNYLEWGSGGSTVNFPRWVQKAVSIEHDERWCAQMRARLSADQNLSHVDYRCVPVKAGRTWRGGYAEGDYRAFQKYVDEIENVGIDEFDVVLIDGRSRVDCAIKALSYIKNNTVVILHDAIRIWGGHYRDVARYYDFLNTVGGYDKQGIAIMRRKQEFANLQGDRDTVLKMIHSKYAEFRNDPIVEASIDAVLADGNETNVDASNATSIEASNATRIEASNATRIEAGYATGIETSNATMIEANVTTSIETSNATVIEANVTTSIETSNEISNETSIET